MDTTATATKPTKRVWVYSRTSGKSDREDRHEVGKKSLELQTARGLEIALAKGWVLVGNSEDNTYSGRTYPASTDKGQIDNDLDYLEYCKLRIKSKPHWLRPGLAEVMDNLARIDAIIIRDITRLCRPFRNSGLLGHLFQRLRTAKVSLEFHNGSTLEPNDDSARMITTVMLAMEDTQTEGKHGGHLTTITDNRNKGDMYRAIKCYGYETHDRKVTPNPKGNGELEVVKGIFAQYLADRSWGDIAKWAQTQDPTRHWTRTIIGNTIRNPIYCGSHKDTSDNLTTAKYMEGVFTPVSRADWQTANARLQAKKTGKQRETIGVHPATGLLKCGYCGGAMILIGPPETRRYRCISVHQCNAKGADCRMAMLPEGTPKPYDLEDHEQIARGVGVLDFLRPLAASAYLDYMRQQNGTEAQKAELAALDLKEAELIRKTAVNTKKWVSGGATDLQYEGTAEEIKVQLEAIAKDRARLQAASAQQRLAEGTDWRLAMYGGLQDEKLKRLLRTVISRVDCYAYHVRVVWRTGESLILPRQVCRNRRTFPYSTVSWVEGSEEPPKIRYCYDEGKPTEVHQFRNITIEVCGKPTKPKASGKRALQGWFKDAYNLPLAPDSPDRL